MTVILPENAETASPCATCRGVGRRQFIGNMSILSLGALLSACGDGVFDGPEAFLDLVAEPIRIQPSDYPELALVSGRAIIRPEGRSPMIVERTGAQTFRAFSLTCPHKGTVIAPTAEGYQCPNHGARFSRDGTWLGGQNTVDLTPVAVQIESSGALLVGGVIVPPPPPRLSVSPAILLFSVSVTGNNPAPKTVAIENTGGGILSGLSLTLDYANNQPTGWLAATLSKLTAPAEVTLSVSTGSLAPGSYSATAHIASASGTNGPQSVGITLVVVDPTTPPAIRLSRASVVLSTTVGKSPTSQTVQIINSGNGTIGALSVAIAYGSGATGWLASTSLDSTSTPGNLTVRAVTGALAVGSYTAVATVSGAGVTPVALPVTLEIAQDGLPVVIADYPALANIGGVADTGQSINFTPIAVVRTGPNSFAAFSRICPHAGSYVQVVNAQSFRCPNHGALFNGNGSLMANSPIQTGSLSARTVRYTPGDPVFYVL